MERLSKRVAIQVLTVQYVATEPPVITKTYTAMKVGWVIVPTNRSVPVKLGKSMSYMLWSLCLVLITTRTSTPTKRSVPAKLGKSMSYMLWSLCLVLITTRTSTPTKRSVPAKLGKSMSYMLWSLCLVLITTRTSTFITMMAWQVNKLKIMVTNVAM